LQRGICVFPEESHLQDHLKCIGHLGRAAERTGDITADNDIGTHVADVPDREIPDDTAINEFASVFFHRGKNSGDGHAGADSGDDIAGVEDHGIAG